MDSSVFKCYVLVILIVLLFLNDSIANKVELVVFSIVLALKVKNCAFKIFTCSILSLAYAQLEDYRLVDYPIEIEYQWAYAKTNFTFHCPGANRNSLVEHLEWYCQSRHKKVLIYQKKHGVKAFSEWRGRLSVDTDYGLVFSPTRGDDTGDYICLLNHRLLPDVVIRFTIIDVPDPPGRPSVKKVSSRDAFLIWNQNTRPGTGNITHYTVMTREHLNRPDPDSDGLERFTQGRYRREEQTAFDANTTQRFAYSYFNTTDNKTEVWVYNLKPARIYTFKLQAWNSQGPSNYSQPSFYTLTDTELPETIVFFSARNISSTVFHLTWDVPSDEKINGEFLGYRLTWAEVQRPEKTMKEMFIRNSSANSWLLTGLWPATDYFMELQVFNPKGNGPPTRVYGKTHEGVPLPPRELKVLNVTDKSMTVGWRAPRRATGINKGYRVYYTHDNSTDQKSLYDDPLNETLSIHLENLIPDTNYSIRIKAFTQEDEGDFSGFISGRTDIRGPNAPVLKNVSCDYNNTLRVVVEKPRISNEKIHAYYIDIYSGGAPYLDFEFLTNGTDSLEFSYLAENITNDMEYEVQVSAGVISHRTGHLVIGEKSEVKKAFVTDGCRLYKNGMSKELWAGMVAGTISVGAIILLSGIGYLIWRIKRGSPTLPTPRRERQDRKMCKAPYYYLDNAQCTPANLDWNLVPETADGVEDYSGPIKIDEFMAHVQKLHADGDIGFSKEYEAIQNDPSNDVNTSESSQHPENKPKNRYLNIIAYDHSRVQLLPMPNQKVSTYINANYIDGFMLNKAYIGTQGPLPSTFDCFWRMIWEQRVTIIIMITNLVERGRRKCDMYWPKEGTEEYGVVQVKLVKEDVMATYTVRTLVIRHNKVRSKKDGSLAEKTVYQYHYTNWPDHGTPDHPLPVISFVKKSASANPPNSGPIVVHCSAGVGRTGTYIVLDAMLKQIKSRSEVNIYGFLKHIRAQRNFLVQTEEQYIFIHDAILEAIMCGETDIPGDMFERYLEVIEVGKEPKNEDEAIWKTLEEQYKQVTSFVARDFNLVSANKPVNQPKNRCAILVPIESTRVHLTPKPGEDGSDYINASWLPGFHNLREYIITQHPQNKEDFWKMCWDHAVQMVVMLSLIDEEEEYKIFWPEGEEIFETDLFTCRQLSVNNLAPFVTKEYALKSVQDDYEIRLKFVQNFNWPNQGVDSIENMYDLPRYCQSLQKLGAGPICVIDRFGGSQAATFCALVTLKKHLEYEQKVDIYMYAKLYHNKRPNVWVGIDDYKKLHACVAALCKQKLNMKDNDALTEVIVNSNGFNGKVVATMESQPCCSKSTDDMLSCSLINCEESPNIMSGAGEIQAVQTAKNSRIPPEEYPLMIASYLNG